MKGNSMTYLEAWREGHKAGMELAFRLINEFTNQEFQTASDVVLYIKDLENSLGASYYAAVNPSEEKPKISAKEKMLIEELAEEVSFQNSIWNN